MGIEAELEIDFVICEFSSPFFFFCFPFNQIENKQEIHSKRAPKSCFPSFSLPPFSFFLFLFQHTPSLLSRAP